MCVRADGMQLRLDVIGDDLRPTADHQHYGCELDKFRRRDIGKRRDIGFLGRWWPGDRQAQRCSGGRFHLGDARRPADYLGATEYRQGGRVYRDLHPPGLHG